MDPLHANVAILIAENISSVNIMIWLTDITQYSRYLMSCGESSTRLYAFDSLIGVHINLTNHIIPYFYSLH